MKKTTNSKIVLAALLLSGGLLSSNAAQTVRELFDNAAVSGTPLSSVVSGTTTLGFDPSTPWVVSPAGESNAANPEIVFQANNIDDWATENGYCSSATYLGPNGVTNGAILPAEGSLAGNGGDLASYDTNNAGDLWISSSWATRQMSSGTAIDFTSGNTYYFTVRMEKALAWDQESTPPDNALGIGFSDGSTGSADFVAVGITRESKAGGAAYSETAPGYWSLDGNTDYGDSLYVSYGTLGQAGYPNHNGTNNSYDSGGPYYVRAVGPLGEASFTNYGFAVEVVGMITTTQGGGAATISAFIEEQNHNDQDFTPPATWDVVSSGFTSSKVMNNLLVFMYGQWPTFIDAIRVSTNYDEAMNQEFYPTLVTGAVAPYVPGNTLVLTAMTESFWSHGDIGLNDSWQNWFGTDSLNYQWRMNGTPFTADGGDFTGTQTSQLTISSAQPTDSGTYDCIVTPNSIQIPPNYWPPVVFSGVIGGATNIVLNTIAPFIATPPANATVWNSAGSSCTFSVAATGAGLNNYAWTGPNGYSQSGASLTSVTISNITATNAGLYTVTVTGSVSPPATASATLTVLVPTPGSFDEAVFNTAVNGAAPWAYWQLNEPQGATVYHDYVNGNNGVSLEPANVTVNAGDGPGTTCAGFSPSQTGIIFHNNGKLQNVNMPPPPYYGGEMTMLLWMNINFAGSGYGLLLNDYPSAGSGQGYGLAFADDNYDLGFEWRGVINQTSLIVPTNAWTFAALVWDVAGNTVAIYLGTGGPLTVANVSLDLTFETGGWSDVNASSGNLLLGRDGTGWAEAPGNAWRTTQGTLSDAAVYTNALNYAAIENLYLSGVGQLLTATQSGSSITLSWLEGTLQAATAVTGPWTTVEGAASPYATTSGPVTFYRVAR